MEKEARISNEARKKKRHDRRARLVELLGGECKNCGSKENLHFDHIDKSQKTVDIANAIDTREDVLMAEVAKCQLLCKDCHRAKTHEAWDYGVPKPSHGTAWAYKKYRCRCDECKSAMKTYNRNRSEALKRSVETIGKIRVDD